MTRVLLVDDESVITDALAPFLERSGFAVQVANILGAGDAFAAGALYGFTQGWDWYRVARLANACGAIVVTQPGCANFTPTLAEALAFIDAHGGF